MSAASSWRAAVWAATGGIVHLLSVAAHGWLVVAAPLRRGYDGGVPSSEAAVVATAVGNALFTGAVFGLLLWASRRCRLTRAHHAALVLAYVAVWCCAIHGTGWEHRVLFGTGSELAFLFGLLLMDPRALVFLVVALLVNAWLVPRGLRPVPTMR
jgi:hypothetical protein